MVSNREPRLMYDGSPLDSGWAPRSEQVERDQISDPTLSFQ